MNIDLRNKVKNDFEKDFFKLVNNAVFGKTMENVRKHRDIKIVTTEIRRNYLISEPNYHTSNFFIENLLAIEMKKTEIIMNRPVYIGLSILELSKILMYEFWYDYVKPKYDEKQSYVIWIQTVSLYTKKQMIFTKILQKMLKQDLTLQIMN